jgi:multisubunit Na+/H+ antiporter MnhC subunit
MRQTYYPYFLIILGLVNLLILNRNPAMVVLGIVFLGFGVFLIVVQFAGARRAARVKTTAAVAPSLPGGVSEELSRLASLRDRGVLSDEEFQAQKHKLLG